MRIQNEHATVDVQSLGAGISDAVFRLPNGDSVSPLYRPPWRGSSDARMQDIPPLLQELSAEWACVPFGMAGVRNDLPADWQPDRKSDDWDGNPHGYGSNHHWDLTLTSDSALKAEITFPNPSPVDRLVRNLWLDPNQPTVHIALTIIVGQPTSLPIGLHPVVDVAGMTAESCALDIPENAKAWTFPTDVEPDRTRFLPDQRACDPASLETAEGSADVTRVPFATETEDLILLTNLDDGIGFVAPEKGYRVDVDWDRRILPSCLLWFSNGGRTGFPWNGINRAIGIEPVAAAFDLGLAYGLSGQTPLAQQGITTAVTVTPEKPLSIDYRIDVSAA